MTDLVGKSFEFDDGSIIKVIQVKKREEHNSPVEVVTYTISQGTNLPRKLVMEKSTFMHNFGHLFGLREPPTFPR